MPKAIAAISLLLLFFLDGCYSWQGMNIGKDITVGQDFVLFPTVPTTGDEENKTSTYWRYFKHYEGRHLQIPLYEGRTPP